MSKGSNEPVLLENSRSVAFRDLPPIPPKHANDGTGTILLFYQYVEPPWTKIQHKQALKRVIDIGSQCHISGRGRVAPEGVNCTLSGKPKDVRSFCYELRRWNPELFNETDFKLTDGVPASKLFKRLSIRKTEELVAYGLAGSTKAPSLQKFAGIHLEAPAYHEAMQEKDTVIVDVRNAYESAIGNFQPPPGGATLLDPKMRNSIEFPKWLNDPSTQEQLNGKKVLMYCTGGIRCERATALLNQMSTVNPNLKPKGVYELRGGIERYIKSYPQGGFWQGKNYLFDRRMEQCPLTKPSKEIEREVAENSHAKCCLCRKKWTAYRGKFKCCQSLCGVPVIVCTTCESVAVKEPERLTCELCKEGYKAPETMPDLVELKRKAEEAMDKRTTSRAEENELKKRKFVETDVKTYDDRLFLSRLPLTITVTKLKNTLGENNIVRVHWLVDRQTGGFYGSCVVQMTSREAAEKAVKELNGTKVDKKRIKISYARVRRDEVWPPKDFQEREYPPVGQ